MNQIDNKLLATYAWLKAGISNNDYLGAFERLVTGLIKVKAYNIIDIDLITEDFKIYYKIEIGYFPMREIMNRLIRCNLIRLERGTGKYRVISENFSNISVIKDIDSLNNNYKKLLLSFKKFSLDRHMLEIPLEEIDAYFISFIEDEGMKFLKNKELREFSQSGDKIKFLIVKFIEFLKSEDPTQYDLLNSIFLGYSLADCLTFFDGNSSNVSYSGLNVVIDTGIAFRLFGIGRINQKNYYTSLLGDAQKMGIKILMFEHSYNEMMTIIQSSKHWIDNCDYDPSLASETAMYFVNNGYSVSDIDEIIFTARFRLSELDIDIIASEYVVETEKYQIDEEKLTNVLIEKYQNNSHHFSLYEKENSIRLDVRSISHVYRFRKGNTPQLLSDARYVFLTTNSALSYVSRKFREFDGLGIKCIPACITDVNLGTVIWLHNPTKLIEMNKSMLISIASASFQPSQKLITRFVDALNMKTDSGKISPEICYMMKSSPYVLNQLVETTSGDVEDFRDDTPEVILQRIQKEAEELGFKKAKEGFDEIIISEAKRAREEKKEVKIELIEALKDKLISFEESFEEFNKKEIDITKFTKNRFRIWCLLVIIFALILIFGNFMLWKYKNDIFNSYESLFSLLFTIGSLLIPIVYIFIKGRSISLISLREKLIEKIRMKARSKFNYSDYKRQEVESEINTLKEKISTMEIEISELSI